MPDIIQFISDIPEKIYGIDICSKERKQYFIESVTTRFQKIIQPEYNNIKQNNIDYPNFSEMDYLSASNQTRTLTKENKKLPSKNR